IRRWFKMQPPGPVIGHALGARASCLPCRGDSCSMAPPFQCPRRTAWPAARAMMLQSPFEAPPQRARTIEVAPGVHWIRMPLPMKLDHINVWAIADGDGWAIVDTGMRTEDSVNAWREVLANASQPGPITRVLVTHMHPDHIGMAGWLTRKFGCRLWMTRLEYLNFRVAGAHTGRGATPGAREVYTSRAW